MNNTNHKHQSHLPVRPGRRMFAGVATIFAAALFVAACGSAGASNSSSDGSNGSESMTLDVVSPTNGATVGTSFKVEVQSNVPFGSPSTGDHHLHLYFDGVKTVGKYDIVYAKSGTVTGLAPGM